MPALGELNEIYQNKTAIDKTLSALGKSTLPASNDYWSSSEVSDSGAWRLDFDDGDVSSSYGKNNGGYSPSALVCGEFFCRKLFIVVLFSVAHQAF